MRGPRTVHGNGGTDSGPPQTDKYAHCTQARHSVHHRTTSHGKTKDDDKPSCTSTGSHLYPFHGRLNQNKNHSMKKGNAKVNTTEQKRKYKLFFTVQVTN